MAVQVHTIPGQLPQGAAFDIIFFANILALFFGNESETEVLQEEVGALATYGSRLIPILNLMYRGTDNLLVLEREPTHVLLDYFKKELGLILPELRVLSHRQYLEFKNDNHDTKKSRFIDALAGHKAGWIDGYVTDDILVSIARCAGKKTVSSAEGSRRGNNKLLLHDFIKSKQMPAFDTLVAANSVEAIDCLKELHRKGYEKAVVKAQIGASGIGMKKVNLSDGVDGFPEYIFFEGPCLVQGWMDESYDNIRYLGSPSVQMFLTQEAINLFDITEQFLSRESVHEGNISSPDYLEDDKAGRDEILKQARCAGQWLYDQGYRGAASCDFHVVDNNKTREIRICELNARVTGATYPSMLSRHFCPQGMWLMRNIRFTPPLEDAAVLSALDKNKLLFRPGQTEVGIIPFNFNSNKEGGIIKAQFLFLGQTREDVFALLEKVTSLANLHGSYDRD